MGIRGFTAFAFGPPLRFYGACAGLLLCAAETPPGNEPAARATIARCELTGTVDSGSAAYLLDCVRRAEQAPSEALLVRVDTPGGSLDATREIVGAFLGSKVPVLVWVGPAGAHAGSAGVFITLAGNVAAMAPGTNIGAAHPVEGMGGKDPEANGKQMARKIENDTAAFAESIAHQRGRNEAWAIEAVRESTSLTVCWSAATDAKSPCWVGSKCFTRAALRSFPGAQPWDSGSSTSSPALPSPICCFSWVASGW